MDNLNCTDFYHSRMNTGSDKCNLQRFIKFERRFRILKGTESKCSEPYSSPEDKHYPAILIGVSPSIKNV